MGGERRGRLKIFFGYAEGVGKTYAMLEAAHQARARGTDVAVGVIEPHARPQTAALLRGLEQLPARQTLQGTDLLSAEAGRLLAKAHRRAQKQAEHQHQGKKSFHHGSGLPFNGVS